MMRGQSLYDYCMENGRQELLEQWDAEKNAPLTPETTAHKPHRKVWWKGPCGHEWEQLVDSRTGQNLGCPICANRVVLPGFNDLATTHPALASEWDQEKNGDLTPKKISYGSDRKVWWRCALGHEWQATSKTRVRMATGCPVCAGRVALTGYNDLKTQYPLIAAEWNYEKNAPLTPEQVVAGSNRTVWWRCSLGHEWRAAITYRAIGTNQCPYCTGNKVLVGFNDLATIDPEVAAQWHPTLNGELLPTQVTAGTHRRVWWFCPKGHIWRTAVANRTNAKKRTGCPVCVGNISKEKALYYQRLMEEAESELRLAKKEESGDTR